MAFIRRIEDFTCVNCGYEVSGNGYTNHCPACLYSLHVDNDPGDRLNPCQGQMAPIGLDLQSGEYIVTFECQECKAIKRCKTSPEDQVSTFLANML